MVAETGNFRGMINESLFPKESMAMSENVLKYSVARDVESFLSYHGFTPDEKTVTKGKVKQNFGWEANSVILVSVENDTKRRTAVAHTTFFKHDGSVNTLEDKQTLPLNNEEDVDGLKGVIEGYMSQTPWRKSQSGKDLFAAVMNDGRQVGVFSLNALLRQL